MSRFIMGLIFLAFGLVYLLSNFGVIDIDWSIWDILFTYWPLILIFWGLKELLGGLARMFTRTRRLRGDVFFGLVLTVLGVIFQGNKLNWFYIGWGDIFKTLFAILIIYIGYTLIFNPDRSGFVIDLRNKKIKEDWMDEENDEYNFDVRKRNSIPSKRSMLVGSLNFGRGSWNLEDMRIWMGVGEIDVDLSQAIIPDGESYLELSGLVGDINIIVPEDLAVAIEAEARIGDVYVFGNSQSGIQRFRSYQSENYATSPKKVHILVSLTVGDVTIKRAY